MFSKYEDAHGNSTDLALASSSSRRIKITSLNRPRDHLTSLLQPTQWERKYWFDWLGGKRLSKEESRGKFPISHR